MDGEHISQTSKDQHPEHSRCGAASSSSPPADGSGPENGTGAAALFGPTRRLPGGDGTGRIIESGPARVRPGWQQRIRAACRGPGNVPGKHGSRRLRLGGSQRIRCRGPGQPLQLDMTSALPECQLNYN